MSGRQISPLSVGMLGAIALALLGTAEARSPVRDPADRQVVFGDRVQVTEVLLEVVVTDRKGAPVLGLGADDFRVFEEGVEVELTQSSYESYGAVSAAEDPLPGTVTEDQARLTIPTMELNRRYFILLFHDLIFLDDKSTLGLLSQRMRAGRGIRRWVQEHMETGDWVAVASYDSRLRLYQDFTDDREAILAGVNRVMARNPEPESLAPTQPVVTLGRYLPTGEELRDQTTNFRKGLRVLASAAGQTSGRKHVLLFTIGTGLSESSRALIGPDFTPSYLDLLNQNDLVVYPVDLTPPGVEHALAWSLVDLAEATGGTYFGHLDEFHKPLRSISNSLHGFYLLSYRTSIPTDWEGSREIRVRSRKSGHQVSSRRAYTIEIRQ